MSLLDVDTRKTDQSLIDNQGKCIRECLGKICPSVAYKIAYKTQDEIYHRGLYYSSEEFRRRFKGTYIAGMNTYSLIDVVFKDDCFYIEPVNQKFAILLVVMNDEIFDEFNSDGHLPTYIKFAENTRIQILYGNECRKRYLCDDRFILEGSYKMSEFTNIKDKR